jgi:hypothetical protein
LWLRDLPDDLAGLLMPCTWIVAAAIGVRLAFRGRPGALEALGLRTHAARGIAFGAVISAPMLMTTAFAGISTSYWSSLGPWWVAVLSTLVWPVGEETMFRAVLVQVPVRFGSKRFWTVALLSASLYPVLLFDLGMFFPPDGASCAFLLASTLGLLVIPAAFGIWLAWLLAGATGTCGSRSRCSSASTSRCC